MLRRQKAAGRPPCSQGPLSSNLPGGALEVCHAEVGGWRVGETEFYMGGCLCVVSVSRCNGMMRVQVSAALGGQNVNIPYWSLFELAAVLAHFALALPDQCIIG